MRHEGQLGCGCSGWGGERIGDCGGERLDERLYGCDGAFDSVRVGDERGRSGADHALVERLSDNVGVTGYRLYLGGSQVGTVTGTSYTFGGLVCGTTYSLGVAAEDAAGNVSSVATLGRQTLSCTDLTAPSTPSGLATSGVGQSSITLSWSASTDNLGVTGYRLYRGGSQVGTTSGTSYTFGGLSCGTTYVLGVAAVDAAGNVSSTASVNGPTAACPDLVAPSTPGGVVASAAGQTSVSLSWSAATDNVGVTGYRLYQNGSQVGTSFTLSYFFSGLVCGTSYSLAVAAVDAAGNVSAAATVSAATAACSDTVPPATPSGLTMSANTQTSITLVWNATTDNVGVSGYRLWRDGSVAGTTTSTSYTYTGLSCGTSFTLALEAFDAAGNTSLRAEATTIRSTLACSGGTSPPPSGSASVLVSPSGNDSTCVRGDLSKPCATLNRAYRAAQRGDLVEVAGGNYAAQPNVVYDASKDSGSGVVTIAAAAGQTPNLGDLDVNGARHLELKGLTVGTIRVINYDGNATSCNGSQDVTLRNLTGSLFYVVGYVCNTNIIGGSYGPSVDAHPIIGECGCGTVNPGPHDTVVDGVRVHDISSSHTAGVHTECMQIGVGNYGSSSTTNVTIRDSKFGPCPADSGGSQTVTGGVAMGGLRGFTVFENNWIGPGTNIGLALSHQIDNLTVQYNSSTREVAFNNDYATVCGSGCGPYTFRANYMSMNPSACSTAKTTYAYNVWQGATCGSTDTNIAGFNFVDAANFDLHLSPSANAINKGDPANYPTTDMFGTARPLGGRADAGAQEAG